MNRFLQICFAFIITFFIFPIVSFACSCGGSGMPCEAFWNTTAVFSGEVTEVITNKSVRDGNTFTYQNKQVKFNIKESFRGIESEKVEITTGAGGGDCGYNFQVGQSYLVYAYQDKETGKLGTGICTRTQPLEKATEDIDYFRSLVTAKSGGNVFGYVTQTYVRKQDEPYRQPTPLANIPVTLERNEEKIETKTDENGKYNLEGLAAGEYSIKLKVPDYLWGYEDPVKIKVNEKGCAGYYFALQIKTTLSGKILNEKDEPAAKISVRLVPVDQINLSSQQDTQYAYTDDEGRFIFRSIPNGTYYLGVRMSGSEEPLFPYPRTFYPGTLDLTRAKTITIQEGQILENYDFKLPKKLSLRKIEGKVFFPDGKPAVNASLTLNENDFARTFSFWGVGQTKNDGSFSFTIVDGVRYILQTHIGLPGGQFHAEPIEIPARGDFSEIKFVITEPGGTCEKCRNWKRSKQSLK